MNLQEHIRRIIREETFIKVPNEKYSNLIKKAVLDYVDFYMCGLSITKIPDVKDQYIVIMIVEKYLKSSYREELQEYLNDIIPLKIYVSIADGMNCEKYSEGRSLQETFKKKSSLMKNIEDIGLYSFMEITGISLPEIYNRAGELPRSVLEQYLIDCIMEEGYETSYDDRKRLIATTRFEQNKYIDFMSTDGKTLYVEISEYSDDFDDPDDVYITSASNLSDSAIFELVNEITEHKLRDRY